MKAVIKSFGWGNRITPIKSQNLYPDVVSTSVGGGIRFEPTTTSFDVKFEIPYSDVDRKHLSILSSINSDFSLLDTEKYPGFQDIMPYLMRLQNLVSNKNVFGSTSMCLLRTSNQHFVQINITCTSKKAETAENLLKKNGFIV